MRVKTNRIGVAISTMGRRRLALATLDKWRMLMPIDSVLVVVDDCSDEPFPDTYGVKVVRHEYRKGVAATKNRCIAELMDAGCDHIWLSDDDVHPKRKGWFEPYVYSPESHLSYQWPKPGKNSRWRIAHDDGYHFALSFPRGVLLYATREVIETVGGMDTAHGSWGGEHVEWSQRIHDAGLTTWPYADVCGSDRIWYSHDKERGNTNNSTFPLKLRRQMAKAAGMQWGKNGTTFVPYREGEGMQDYSLGPRLGDDDEATLRHVLGLKPSGIALEFGVAEGRTIKLIAEHMPVVGFDSWQGLPEDWSGRPEFPAGFFACDKPAVPENVILVEGWFEDTLPTFDWDSLGYVGLVHLDADIYSSTRTVLENIGHLLLPGTYVVMDEAHGYPGSEDHEMKAWREIAEQLNLGWTIVGHSREQVAYRIV